MLGIENQTIEFKLIWKDEYLKEICGFANSHGGTLYIGVDDEGNVVGVKNAKQLVEELPNKIISTLGIVADVSLQEYNGINYIKIVVEEHTRLVYYKSKIYKRSGSTNQEITGLELERIMFNYYGKKWESYIVPNASLDDISLEAIKYFKDVAVRRGKLSKKDVDIDLKTLLINLGLYDGDKLNYAGVLLFCENPERWVRNAYVKIGFFAENDSDLLYHDEVHGPLILQVDKVMELVYIKYLKALIRYEGIQRIEEYIFPYDAFRELLLNSIVHKVYETQNTIQISVYEDKIYIGNEGKFPKEIERKDLFKKHVSIPYNPIIAETFYKAGFIESWGRGFEYIKEECKRVGNPLPKVQIYENCLLIRCNPSKKYLELLDEMNDKVITRRKTKNNQKYNEVLNDTQIKILNILVNNPRISQKELMDEIKLSRPAITKNLKKLKDKGFIERLGSDRNGFYKVIK